METIYFGNILVSGLNLVHDSAKERCRKPLGAVSCGTVVTLSLYIRDLHFEQAALCVLRGGTVDRVPLVLDDVTVFRSAVAVDGEEVLRAQYQTPADATVLWYWFEITLQGGGICYYGAETGSGAGLGKVYKNPPPSFQLTVFDADFRTPAWAKRAILYQIFPDRFCCGDPARVREGVAWHQGLGRDEMKLHENPDDLPVYEAQNGRPFYMPCDLFGGDLEGIRQRLPYLASLGISLLYLNPIFEAASNHRYNTGDYSKIDPVLGDEESFRQLCGEARTLGMHIVLDGVFSHTGDDSVYFNKYGHYADTGAYQSKESPYFSWYRFASWPNKYKTWWGFGSLPEVNKSDPSWQDFLLDGEHGVLAAWQKRGASGWRLDVADELPDETIERIRTSVKRQDPDAFLIGEVWEDATTKQSYGETRRYALGRGLDAVMNYPFLNQTVAFLTGGIGAVAYRKFLVSQKMNYPAEMYYTLMNLLSSHDVARVRTLLSHPMDPHKMSRAEQAVYAVTPKENALGGQRQRLAAAIQFSMPGIPAVYYGDEVGMTGLLDPFNRKMWREEDPELLEWYKKIAQLRQEHPALQTGYALFYSTNGNVLGILRYTMDGKDAFGETVSKDAVLTVVNPTAESHRIVIDLAQEKELQPLAHREAFLRLRGKVAKSLISDRTVPLLSGLCEIEMAPVTADFFRLIWEETEDA
ncbi:MAG: glycoside hydrolase family 13 protein [Clostridiales bacterium]|nr:glycoside hydrolase family 13 protein [Clostridiales bacterium]